MSAATDRRRDAVEFAQESELITATDTESGVSASAETKAEALARLADALELHAGGGTPIEDEESFLDELGIEETEATSETPPWLE